jgi:hypothetical protein
VKSAAAIVILGLPEIGMGCDGNRCHVVHGTMISSQIEDDNGRIATPRLTPALKVKRIPRKRRVLIKRRFGGTYVVSRACSIAGRDGGAAQLDDRCQHGRG